MEKTTYGDGCSVPCPRCEMPVSLSGLQGVATCVACVVRIELAYEVTSYATIDVPESDFDDCANCGFDRWLHSQDLEVHVAVCASFVEP